MNSLRPKVSIIIVNYNGMAYLDACLSSVLNQGYQDYEVILVNNASTDGSLEYVRQKYPGLIFVENKENSGYAGGINAGLVIANGVPYMLEQDHGGPSGDDPYSTYP